MTKEFLSRKGIENKKGQIILFIITLLLITLPVISSFSLPNNLYKKEYFKGKFTSVNEAANLIDYIDEYNVILSPYNFYTSINYLYTGTDNNSYKQIKAYTELNSNEFNDLINYFNSNNAMTNIENNDISKLYNSLITELYNNNYHKITVNKIKNLNDNDKINLITLIIKINTSYNNLIGLNNYGTKYINELKPTKEELSYSSYEIRFLIDQIINNNESYLNKNKLININKLYMNTSFYDANSLLNGYKDTVTLLDFSSENANQDINSVINTLTDNEIKYYISEEHLSSYDNLYLNTLIFNMEWEDNINPKNNSSVEFTSYNDKMVIADTMKTMSYSYLDNGYAKGFIKNFSNPSYIFVAILPNELDDKLSNIDVESLIESENVDEQIVVTMPKFSYQSSIDLNELYKKVGLSDLTNTKANFHNLIDSSFNLDYNIQKNIINIGEKGTFSSNIQSQELETFTTYDDQKQLIFDRPFYYLIMNKDTKQVLYVGKVSDPTNRRVT